MEWRVIVGVVGDVHHDAFVAQIESEMYVPYAQVPNVEARPTIVLRSSIDPASATSTLRKAVSDIDPNVAIDRIETMKQIVHGSVAASRFRTALLVVFALLALFVGAVGLYGVMSYSVSQWKREFGIRMAIGASRSAILQLVLVSAAKLVAIGICAGLAGALLLAKLIASLLYGITPFDILTLASVSILLATVALAASCGPAMRGANANPMDSLRCE